MKAVLYSQSGEKKGSIDLPSVFDTKIREDIVQKYLETEKFLLANPYSHAPEAGRQHSASGTISHKRHDWKGHYGKGMSRAPRKVMWRRGTQFYWIGAEVSGARGGRRVHGPSLIKRIRKINKKEVAIAFGSVFASTANSDLIVKRYSSLNKISSAPFVIDSLPSKSKELIVSLKKILSDSFTLAFKKKSVRAGRGKSRGRKYKSTAGLLIVTGNSEKARFAGFDVKPVSEILISDLYPLGRIVVYTQKALDDLAKGVIK